MPEADLQLLTDAARAAGDIAHRFWRAAPRAWDKPDGGGPVSEADLAVNDYLQQHLCAARPRYGWLSEESPDGATARMAHERVFVVDPIDGTRAFLAGQAEFAHSLAVVAQGRVTAAVVYLPERGLIYAASASGPARLNGQILATPAATPVQGATVLAPAAVTRPEHWRSGAAPSFVRAFRPSLAWRLCLVAEGQFDAVLTLRPAWEWDIAAGALIAARAGVTVSDRSGGDLVFNRSRPQSDGLLAAPAALHAELLHALLPPDGPAMAPPG